MSDMSEADTRAKLIDPAIHARGWTEDLIKREESAGAVEIVAGKARRKSKGRTDYTLRVLVNPETQPVALALLEAKKESLPPGHVVTSIEKGARARQKSALKRGPLQRVLPLSFGMRVPELRKGWKDVDGGALRIDSSEGID